MTNVYTGNISDLVTEEEYLANKPTIGKELKKGIGRGIDLLQANAYGALAAHADVAKANTVRDWAEKGQQSNMQEAAQNPAAEPSFTDLGKAYSDGGIANGIGRTGLWAAGAFGELAPQGAASMASGAIGKRLGGGAGSAGLMMANNVAQETGSIYGDILEKTGKREGATAIQYGIPAALIDTAVEAVPVRKVLGSGLGSGSIIKDAAKAGVKQLVTEAPTEAIQTGIERAAVTSIDPNQQTFTPEGWKEIIDSAAAGGIGGAISGAGAEGIGRGLQTFARNKQDQGQGNLTEEVLPVAPQPIQADPIARHVDKQVQAAASVDPSAGPLSKAVSTGVDTGAVAIEAVKQAESDPAIQAINLREIQNEIQANQEAKQAIETGQTLLDAQGQLPSGDRAEGPDTQAAVSANESRNVSGLSPADQEHILRREAKKLARIRGFYSEPYNLAMKQNAKTEMARLSEQAAKDAELNKVRAKVDGRLNVPEFQDQLVRMADNAGWEEIGGRVIMRDLEGNGRMTAVGRTPWAPKEEWFVGGLGRKEQIQTAVRKAINGEKLSDKQRQIVEYMLDFAGENIITTAQRNYEYDQFFEKHDINGTGNMTEAEMDEFFNSPEFMQPMSILSGVGMPEEGKVLNPEQEALVEFVQDHAGDPDVADAIAVFASSASQLSGMDGSPETISKAFEAKARGDNERQQQEQPISESAQGESTGGIGRGAEWGQTTQGEGILQSYTSEEIAQREADAKAAADQKRLADQRAEADEQLSSFTLTGSDRQADTGAAAGQNDMFGASSSRPKTNSDEISILQHANSPVTAEDSSVVAQPTEEQKSDEPNIQAARDLLEKYKKSVGNKLAEGKIRKEMLTLASKTDLSEHPTTAMALDMLATRLGYDGDMGWKQTSKETPKQTESAPVQNEYQAPTWRRVVVNRIGADGLTDEERTSVEKKQAPGTRINGDAERAAADRLEKLHEKMGVIAHRNSREGNAKATIRSVIEELRKPNTVSSVVPMLEAASNALMKQYGAFAQVVSEVADSLNGQNDELDAEMRSYERKAEAAAQKQEQPQAQAKEQSPETAPEQNTEEAQQGRFSNNKLFTEDKVAAARARMKSKFGQLNSGIDPEMLVDGMTIAGAYIESGIRSFTQYSKAMISDFGDGVKPYLLSFWEAARNYPGLNTQGMTSAEESLRQHQEQLTPKDKNTPAVGKVAEKPAARTKKTGAKGDMVLTQDWGVEDINGYGDSSRENGNDTKDAFLKEARTYLNAVADRLRAFGFEPHKDGKGREEKPVHVNESGMAGSGDVTLTMHNPDTGQNAYVHIGDSALRGVVPMTPSGIAVMYRLGAGDRYATKAGNTWAPVDLSANDLAQLVVGSVRANMESEATATSEESTNANPDQRGRAADQGRAPEVSGRGGRDNGSAARADTGDLEGQQSQDVSPAENAGGTAGDGVRVPDADVGGKGQTDFFGDAGNGRARAGRTRPADAGAKERSSVKNPESVSPANPGPGNFHIENPLEIVGGGQVARFDKNRSAIELLSKIREESRQATAEEQRVLAGYTGWGSFGQELFQGTWDRPMPKSGWEARDSWLRDHLGKDEWEAAQNSIINAHYTDPPTVMAMWDMVRRMGFTGGRVLEPSMGIGNFFGMMPLDLKTRSQLAGIELDSLTGSMAQLLYPDANIKIMGYQESKTPDNFYDVVIGNWPFANFSIADRRYNTLNPFVHDYFFLKAVDQVRPGGLVVGITSSGTMDKRETRIRAALAKKAELVTSIRLPSGAFEEYAGTKVVTDIIILKKREQALSLTPNDSWLNSVAYKTPSGEEVHINEFYVKNPGNVIGVTDFGHGTTRGRAGMIVHRPENMAERLKEAVSLVPQNIISREDRTKHISYITNHTADREGSLTEQGGQLYVVRGEHLAPAHEVRKYQVKSPQETANREKQLQALIDMRRKYAALIEADRTGNAETQRADLRKAFEAFEKKHGALGDSFGLDYLGKIDDPFYPALAALSVNGKPAAILRKSTMRGAVTIENPTIQDAYVLARNKSVQPSVAEIAAIAGKSEAAVRESLVKSGAVFEAPNGDVVPSDIYLSGNVRQKLREAKAALQEGNKAMERNVAELEKVVPADIPYFNIESQLGATWVPAKVYAEYVAHMLNRPNAKGIEVTFINGRWKARLPESANNSPEARTGFGTAEYPFSKLVNAALTNQTIKIRRKDSDGTEYVDQEATAETNARIGEIRGRFAEWLWSDPERRSELEQEYNEVRNAYATPKYDGSFLSFEGMALSLGTGPFNLRGHQANAIWRALVNRRSINAHEVGTGKTYTMGGIAVESRRYGIAKKPMILAHNANSASVAHEIQMMYPAAKILYVDNLSKDTIAVKMRQIANDDWDAIVLPHSLLDRLSFKEETLMAMAQDDIKALEEEAYAAAQEDGVEITPEMLTDEDELKKLRSVTAKELVKARNRIIETIRKQSQQSSREDFVPFEDLGIDMVLVDEVHEFKKPPISTRMNMKGLNTQTSNRSIALQFVTRYIRANNFGGNVHTFTGTPITNTMTEIYHQMKYVMEDEMKAAGVESWDGWFGSFAKEVQDVELSAAGEYETITRLAGFINVPELRRMIGQYMDVVFADDMPEMRPREVNGKTLTSPDLTESERAQLLNGRTEDAKDRPYKKVINVTSDLTPEQSRIFAELQGYAKAWRNMTGKQRKEAMAAGSPESPIITEGLANKASFDVRLTEDERWAGQEGSAPDEPGSKSSKLVANVLEIYKSDKRAAQVIFSEMGYSTSQKRSTGRNAAGDKTYRTVKTFSTMKDIVERLIQGGIPREQIAVVDGSTSKEKRKEIADGMNSLRIRVVIGSTDTLGVGVNMQRNLRAMHHMDAPYMPGELEQRNGRGLRQGNQWNTVLEYRYMTDRLDGRRWQILAIKQRFINAFMKANNASRVIEGDAASDEESDILQSFSEAAGDPRILIRAKLQKNVEALQRAERMHTNGVADARRALREARQVIDHNRSVLKQMTGNNLPERLREMVSAQVDDFRMTIDGQKFDVRKDAEEAIDQFMRSDMRMDRSGVPLGAYRDQPITARWLPLSDRPEIVLNVDGQEFVSTSLRGMEQLVRNYPQRIAKVEANIAQREGSLDRLQEVANAPFSRATDLENAQKRLTALERDIEMNPVPPPAWLRSGAPIDSAAYRDGKEFVVTGHRWSSEGWFVLGQDAKGEMSVPYMEVTDAQGMPLYEEHEFHAPEVIQRGDKPEEGAATKSSEINNGNFDPENRDIRQRRVEPVMGGNTITREKAQEIVDRFVSQYKGSASLGFTLYDTKQQAYGQEALKRHKLENAVMKGAYHKGKIHLILADHKDEADLLDTIRHEAWAHFGFDLVNPSRKAEILKSVKADIESNGSLVAIMEQVKRNYRADDGSLPSEAELLEEVVAKIAEKYGHRINDQSMEHSLRAAIRRIWETIMDSLRSVGLARYIRKDDGIKMAVQFLTDSARKQRGQISARFDNSKVDLNSMKGDGKWYYSALKEAAADMKQEKGSPEQMLAMLSRVPGVKSSEIEATGLKEFMQLQGKSVTKQQIMDYLQGNGVQVQETVLGAETPPPPLPEGWRVEQDGGTWIVYDEDGEYMAEGATKEDAMRDAADDDYYADYQDSITTKFGQYQLPGGKNYRELLLTLPAKEKSRKLEVINNGQIGRGWILGVKDADTGEVLVKPSATPYGPDEFLDRYYSGHRAGLDKDVNNFRSSHYDQPNILAHVRFNERTDAEGKRVLFIEEIQSDWAQEGRKKGFKADRLPDGWVVENTGEKTLDGVGVWQLKKSDGTYWEGGQKAYGKTKEKAEENFISQLVKSSVPSAPFVTSTDAWVSLAMKRMIAYAVDNGFDRIAWTTGEQQADRYDLSKQVDSVEAFKNDDGTWDFEVYKDGKVIDQDDGVHESKLESLFGKDLAKKIIGEEGEFHKLNGWRSYAGEDLKVGGEGMKSFYDKIVPKMAKEVTKKMGGKLAAVDIGTEQPGFDITPEMRDAVDAGLPLFSRNAGDSATNVTFYDPQQPPEQLDDLFFRRASEGDASAVDVLKTHIQDRLQPSLNTFNWWNKSVGTQFHKAWKDKDYKKVFDQAQYYLNDTNRFAMESADLAPGLLPKVNSFADIMKSKGASRDDIEKIADSIYTGTLDDKKVYTNQELSEKFGLNDRQRALYREFRKAINHSLDAMTASEIAKEIKDDPELHGLVMMAKYRPERALEQVVDVLDARAEELEGIVQQMEKGKAPAEEVKPYKIAAMETRKTLQSVRDKLNHLAKMKNEGYAPLMRFGKYTVTVTNNLGEIEYFGMFEKQSEARAMERAMSEEYGVDAQVSVGVMSQEAYKLYAGMSPDTLELFGSSIGFDKSQSDVFQDYLRMSRNNRSALKRLIRRKGTAGFSKDVTRSLASFITSNARQASSNWHLGEMDETIEQIRLNKKEKGDVIDEAIRLRDYLRNPKDEAAAVRNLLFINYIGGLLASALTNMTQPITMTGPYLAQFGSATKHLLAAQKIGFGSKADGDLGKAMERATDEGTLAPHEVYQLHSEAIRNLGSNIYIRKAITAWGRPFALAETYNRRLTFAAAYNMAKENPSILKQARSASPYSFAVKAVQETQGIYNKGNRPNWARGALGATVFTFKQYSISYLEFLQRLPRKQQLQAIGILFLLAGINGLPFGDDIEDLIDTIAQMMGYNLHSRSKLRELAIDTLGETAGDFIVNGASSLPGSPIDVQARMGLGNLIPGTGILKRSTADKTRDVAEAVGPAGGMAISIGQGIGSLMQGDIGSAAMAAAPNAAKNAVSGGKIWATGQYRDQSGRLIAKDVGAIDGIWKMIGFSPSSIAKESRVVSGERQRIALARDVESKIADRWAEAIVEQDADKLSESKMALADWNEKNPDTPIRITLPQIRQRVRAMGMDRRERLVKSAPKELRGMLQ